MVIGHEITHGFDDNGEKITQKTFFQLHSLRYKKLKLHTAVTEGSMHTYLLSNYLGPTQARYNRSVEHFAVNVS